MRGGRRGNRDDELSITRRICGGDDIRNSDVATGVRVATPVPRRVTARSAATSRTAETAVATPEPSGHIQTGTPVATLLNAPCSHACPQACDGVQRRDEPNGWDSRCHTRTERPPERAGDGRCHILEVERSWPYYYINTLVRARSLDDALWSTPSTYRTLPQNKNRACSRRGLKANEAISETHSSRRPESSIRMCRSEPSAATKAAT